MLLFDNLMIPVIITDRAGRIKYKNDQAKRSIPSPRSGANIYRRINKHINFPIPETQGLRVLYITNEKSAYNRCFLLEHSNENILIFPPELILAEPEDIKNTDPEKLRRFAYALRSLAENSECCDDDLAAQNFARMESAMLMILKHSDFSANMGSCCLIDVLKYIRKNALSFSSKFNIKLNVHDNTYNIDNNHRIRFVPFAVTYSYLCMFSLNISQDHQCDISAERFDNTLSMRFELSTSIPSEYIGQVLSVEKITKLFPNDRFNAAMIYQKNFLYNYGLTVCCPKKDRIQIDLEIPLGLSNSTSLFQSYMLSVQKYRFKRICMRATSMMNALFMGLKE